MKNLLFILFFTPFISYCQVDSEFKLQKNFSEKDDKICITKNDCFSFSTNTDEVILTICYTNEQSGNKQTIDSMDISGIYDLTLHSFQSEKDGSSVVLLELETEYHPYFNAYYISKGKIVKIGEWGIAIPYIEYRCEYCGYSVEDIQINQRDGEIVFAFLKNMDFFDNSTGINNNGWVLYKAGELVLSFNIVDKSLKVIEKDR